MTFFTSIFRLTDYPIICVAPSVRKKSYYAEILSKNEPHEVFITYKHTLILVYMYVLCTNYGFTKFVFLKNGWRKKLVCVAVSSKVLNLVRLVRLH